MTIAELLQDRYAALPLTNEKDSLFYYFIQDEFGTFLDDLKKVEKASIEGIIEPLGIFEYFQAPYTKRRVINFMRKLCDRFLQVLAFCYKGDLAESHKELNKILARSWTKCLVESYLNNFSFDLKKKGQTLYRMRDEKETDDNGSPNIVDNCFHIPFEKRKYATTGRYNMLGYPCLYLGDSKETCNKELGKLKEGKHRWVSEFCPQKTILLYDLRIPTKTFIKGADKYDLFCMLLTYPLIVLCTTKVKNQGYNEEYLMPQLIFQSLFTGGHKNGSHMGIAYSSTKHNGGYNVVMPATYSGKYPPKKGYSQEVLDVFDVSKPEIYR